MMKLVSVSFLLMYVVFHLPNTVISKKLVQHVKRQELPPDCEALECIMTPWTEWGPCVRSPPCENHPVDTTRSKRQLHDEDAESFPMQATTAWDEGRSQMTATVQAKEKTWADEQECRDHETCPDLAIRWAERDLPCEDGLAGVYPCRHVDLIAFLDFEDLGHNPESYDYIMGNDIWGWTDPDTGDEYVIIGLSVGTSFVRITDPRQPEVLAFLHTRTVSSSWRDIKVVNNAAYIVSEAPDHGMQVVDLTQFRGQTKFFYINATVEYSLFGSAHNVVSNVETEFIYVVGARQYNYDLNCAGGLHMIDVHDALNPTFAGCFSDDGYTHDAECVIYRGPDERYFEREICFAFNEDSLTIVDVSNKSSPYMVSKRGYVGSAYTHQGALTFDHRMLFLDDEVDEIRDSEQFHHTKTYIWNVEDLEDPFILNTYISQETAIDHNMYLGLYENLVYQSNYEAGLRILHIEQDNAMLREVAYFDVLPSSTTASFRGTWSNYPFFESGVIPVSSIDFGLFLLGPRYDEIEAAIWTEPVWGEQIRHRHVIDKPLGLQCPTLVQTRECPPDPCA